MKETWERLRLCHVKRWHIVRVAREQTVAEHSYNVWVITDKLLEFCAFSERERRLALEWALVHDEPEALFGDIPTSAKRASGKLDAAVGELNSSCIRWATVRDMCDTENTHIRALVKIADTVEAIWFLRQEAVSYHAKTVVELLCAQLAQLLGDTPFFVKGDAARHYIRNLTGVM